MIEREAVTTANRIFRAIFERDNPYSLQELQMKFAKHLDLPTEVVDTRSGEKTYTILPDFGSFITEKNSELYGQNNGWLIPRHPIRNLRELFELAKTNNFLTTERVYDSENVHLSDPIYKSENIYGSTNCGRSKNLLFCSGTYNSNFSIASARSDGVDFCLQADDSNSCTNSYMVICSGKISNSLFIQDASNLHECILCSHLNNKSFCVANMQFSEKDYFYLKRQIVEWLFTSDFASPFSLMPNRQKPR